MCVRMVGLEYSWWGSLPFGSVGLPLLALGASQVEISWCTRPTYMVGFASS